VVVVVGSVEALVGTSLLSTSVVSIEVTAGIASLAFLPSIAIVASIMAAWILSWQTSVCSISSSTSSSSTSSSIFSSSLLKDQVSQ